MPIFLFRLKAATFVGISLLVLAASCNLHASVETRPIAVWSGDADDANWPARLEHGVQLTAGLEGRAFSFDGQFAHAATDLAVSPAQMPETTWMAWIKPRLVDGRRLILEADDGGFDRFIAIEDCRLGVTTGHGIWFPVDAIVDTWQHVAAVFTSDIIRFYFNGKEFVCPDAPVGQESKTSLRFGGSPLWQQFFAGEMDDVRIYDHALSQSQIQSEFERLREAATQPPSQAAAVTQPAPKNSRVAAESTQLRQLAKDAMRKAGLRSLGIAVIRNGNLENYCCLGRDQEKSLRDNEKIVIASCSKSFTATLAAVLVSKGKLSWETTLEQVFGKSIRHIHPEFRKVTLAQLLHHTAGAPERDKFWGSQDLRTASSLRGSPKKQRQKMMELILSKQPDAPPGTKTIYSNAGYYMAAAMMEEATGTTWENLLKDFIFRPLKLQSASALSDIDPPLTMPAGGISANLRDLATFYSAHMDYAKAALLGISRPDFEALHTSDDLSAFGKGFVIAKVPWSEEPVYTHVGINAKFTTVFWLAPAEQFGVIATTWQTGEAARKNLEKAVWHIISTMLSSQERG